MKLAGKDFTGSVTSTHMKHFSIKHFYRNSIGRVTQALIDPPTNDKMSGEPGKVQM
jgi:hypothetical protein